MEVITPKFQFGHLFEVRSGLIIIPVMFVMGAFVILDLFAG